MCPLKALGQATQSLPEEAVCVLDHADTVPGVGGEDAARLTLILCDLAHSSAVTRVGASMALVLTTSKRLQRHGIGCVRHPPFSTLCLGGTSPDWSASAAFRECFTRASPSMAQFA